MAATSSPGLDELIARGRRGEAAMPEVLWAVINAELFVPMSGGDADAVPVVADVGGVPHMSVFTRLERATMVGTRADRSVTLSGRRIIEGLQPGVGLTVVAAEDGGLHVDPDTIAWLKEGLRRDAESAGPAPTAPAPVIHDAPAGSIGVSVPIGDVRLEATGSEADQVRMTSVVHEVERLAPASLREGYSLWFGWVPIIVHEIGPAAFELITPDLLAADGSWTRDLSLPLRVLAEQSALLAEVGQPADAASPGFRDRVIIEVGAEEAESVYLHRIAVERDDDSGWYLGIAAKDHVRGELRAARVADLLRLRRAAMRVLALPDGSMAFFRGDELQSVVDAEDRQLWPRP